MKRELTAEECSVLEKSELFSGLSREELSGALDFFRADDKNYEKGEYLHRMGEKMTRFGLVLAGRVQVYMDDIDGNPIIMANVTEGKTFGESLCFLEREEEPVTIRAASAVKILWLRTEAVRKTGWEKAGKAHAFTMRFLSLVTSRTLSMNDRIQVLSKRTLRQKLLVFFSQCIHQYGSEKFLVPFNRNEMAEYLGTDRSALSRELSRMREEGMIEFSREEFRILK